METELRSAVNEAAGGTGIPVPVPVPVPVPISGDSPAQAPLPGRLYPSHGDVIQDGAKKLREYRKHRTWRENIFMDVLREEWRERPERGGMTAWELCSAVYARQVNFLAGPFYVSLSLHTRDNFYKPP